MKRIFCLTLIIGFLASISFAQKPNVSEKKLSNAVFEKNDMQAISYFQKKLNRGDSSCLIDYASSDFRLHHFERSYQTYKIAHRKNMITKPVHANEFIQLDKIYGTSKTSLIQQQYEKLLSNAGYKKATFARTNFRYTVAKEVCFNSDADDFGIFPIDNFTLFSSTRNNIDKNIENSLIKTYSVKNGSCDAIDVSEQSENNLLKQLGKINSKYHMGPICVSKDKSKIFVTVSQKNKDKKGNYNLTILESHIDKNVYTEFVALPFTNISYTLQHPYYDDKSGNLYFSSNMPGSVGGFDIYKTKMEGTKWITPINIKEINTAATEAFPFVAVNGDIYYSGKTTNGFGGFDILKLENGHSTPVLLDEPLNSAYDDFGIYITDDFQGYFCSNRKSQKGNDNIYLYEIIIPPYLFTLNIKDDQSKANLKDVAAKIKFNDTIITANTDESGSYSFALPGTLEGTNWSAEIGLSKTGYLPLTTNHSTQLGEERKINIEKMLTKEIEVKQVAEKIKVGVDLGKLLNLNPIYFDLNKFNIRPDAAIELDKIVKAMNEMPNLVIELGSHTDSRGSTKSNQTLSQKRAESSGKYILSKGIDSKRLSWKGYGESKPLNRCVDGVKCTEPEYSLNRRTEFKIVKM